MMPLLLCYGFTNKKGAPHPSFTRKQVCKRFQRAVRQVGLVGAVQQEVSAWAQAVVDFLVGATIHGLAKVSSGKAVMDLPLP